MNYQYISKVVIIGDSGCGKSSLMHRLTDARFQSTHEVTLGSDFGASVVRVGDTAIKLQLWDTAGQETYRAVTRSYFRGSSGALLVYDVSRRPTFEHLQQWLGDLRAMAGDAVCVILVGNKSDLEERGVKTEEAQRWAEENKLTEFIETSAKTGANVQTAFEHTAAEILRRIQKGSFDVNDISHGVRLTERAKPSAGCCSS